MKEAIKIISDSAHGIYCPQHCAEVLLDDWFSTRELVKARDVLLSGPDHEDYWEAWSYVEEHAEYTDSDDNLWRLYQDGDVFAYCIGLMDREAFEAFFGETLEEELPQ